MEQKYKVTNLDNNNEVFFFDHSFISARRHARNYIERNINKFPMSLHKKMQNGSWKLEDIYKGD